MQIVDLEPIGQTSYERLVAVVYVGDVNVNEAMVKSGEARAARKYLRKREDAAWCAYENGARVRGTSGRGFAGRWVYPCSRQCRARCPLPPCSSGDFAQKQEPRRMAGGRCAASSGCSVRLASVRCANLTSASDRSQIQLAATVSDLKHLAQESIADKRAIEWAADCGHVPVRVQFDELRRRETQIAAYQPYLAGALAVNR
jgi:hypothetical protein